MNLLVTTYIVPEYLKKLEKMFDHVRCEGMMKLGGVLTEDELIAALKDIDVILIEFDPLTRKVLDASPSLKVIASVRGGAHANVDVACATEKKIPILYCPGRNGDTVADFTLGLMIALARGIAAGHHQIMNNVITDTKTHDQNGFCAIDVNWVGQTPEKFAYLQFKGPTLAGKRLGLVGLGAIGREVAKRAVAFDMEIIAYDPFVKPELVPSFVRMSDLDGLLNNCDFISIHLPVTKDTRGLLSASKLKLMKPNAYFINTARAAVLDYDQLITMLQNNQIAGAALDVYPSEPLPPDHPLLKLNNVVLTPHIGGCSLDPYVRSYQMLVEDLENVFSGKKPVRLYNPSIYAG